MPQESLIQFLTSVILSEAKDPAMLVTERCSQAFSLGSSQVRKLGRVK